MCVIGVPMRRSTSSCIQDKGDGTTVGGTHHYPCNYDNMRGIAETAGAWSDLFARHVCASNEQTCGMLPCRTNAVAVGPVNMMCKLTLTLTNANANFFSSPTRSHTDRVARRNCMPQLRASSFRAPHKTQLHAATAASCKPQLRLSTYFGKTKQLSLIHI